MLGYSEYYNYRIVIEPWNMQRKEMKFKKNYIYFNQRGAKI